MARGRKTKIEQPQTTAQQIGSLIKSARDIMRKDKGLSTDLDRLPLLTWVMFLKFLDDMEQIEESRAAVRGEKYRPAIEPPYRWRDWAAKEDGITGPELLAFINQEEATRPDGKKGAGLLSYLRGLTGGNGAARRRRVIATVFKDVVCRMLSGYLLRDVINKVNGIHFLAKEEVFTLGHLYETMLREMRDAAGENGEFYTPRPVVKFMVEVVNPRLGEVVLDPACGTGGFLVEAYTHLEKQCKTVADRRVLQDKSLRGGEAKPLPYLLCQMNLLLHGLEAPDIDPENSLRFKLTEVGDRDRVDVILTNPPFGGEEETGIKGNFPADMQTAETAILFLQVIMRRLKRLGAGCQQGGRAAVVVPESVMGDPGVAQRVRQALVEEFNIHTVVRLPKGVFEPYSDIQTNLLFFDRSGPTKGIWFYAHEVPEERRGMRNPCYTRSTPLQFDELQPLLRWWNNRSKNGCAWYVSADELAAAAYSFDSRNPAKQVVDLSNPVGIVSALSAPSAQLVDLLPRLAERAKAFESLRRERGAERPLGSFLGKVRKEAVIEEEAKYSQLTVRLYGKGVVLRQVLPGCEIRTRPQFVASAGHLILSRIDARNGAFGLVPAELEGALVTQDFPLFEIDESMVRPEFLAVLLVSHQFLDVCKRASRGTTNRKRLKEDLLLAETIPIPSLEVQDCAVEFMREARAVLKAVRVVHDAGEEFVPSFANYLFA